MLGAQVEGDRLRAQPKSKETGCTPCPNFESDNAGIEPWTQAASCSYGIVKWQGPGLSSYVAQASTIQYESEYTISISK